MSEKGNVLFLILIAVVLFAALSYAVTQSGRGGGAGLDKEKQKLAVSQLLQYTTGVAVAIKRWEIIGKKTGLIRYDVPGSAGYGLVFTQPEQVFHPDGGNATYRNVISDLGILCNNGACNSDVYYDPGNPAQGEFFAGVGTSEYDGYYYLGNLTKEACEAINEALGLSVPVVQDDTDYSYPYTYDTYPGEPVFCYQDSVGDGGNYWFLHAVHPR